MPLPVLVIVGRPNVGKSTLFNRMIGRRKAIVEAAPGVTRDRHYGRGERGDTPFLVVDTGGIAAVEEDPYRSSIVRHVAAAIGEAAFDYLDAPVMRLAAPDHPIPYSPALEPLVVPGADQIVAKVDAMLGLAG